MKKYLILLALILFGFSFAAPSNAKWWIFGQGTDEIVTNYIYINNNSFAEAGQQMTLFKETLKDGNVRINGRASVRNAKIGAVYITTDNKATWEKAKLSKNGYFEYIFRPELKKDYHVFIKIVDTLGKTNDIESTYKVVKVIDENIYPLIVDAITKLVEAYQNEEPKMFMNNVSIDYAGDETILDYAIRKDFTAFDFIQLRCFINNISRDSSGKVYVAIQYIRKVISSKTSQVYADNGYTEFVFKNDNGKFKLFNMKNPLLFGLSDAGMVATGTIQNFNNNPIVLIDEYGNVDEKPFRTAIDIIESGAAISSSETGSFSVTSHGGADPSDFDFSAGSVVAAAAGDFTIEGNILIPAVGGGQYEIGSCSSLNSITSVNSSGYGTGWIFNLGTNVGKCYAIKNPDNTYAVIRIKSASGANPWTTNFDYKYQPDGSTSF